MQPRRADVIIIMRCIVIDDEQLAIDLICSYIEENPLLELAGTFLDLKKAVRFVIEEDVDLIFTDIELNVGMNGLDFVRSIPDAPMVIFISAYDRYAVDSYSVDAVDYLVKPVSKERFFKAVNKAYGIYSRKNSLGRPSLLPSGREQGKTADFIFVKVEDRFVKILLDDILYIKGYGDYIKIFLASGEMLLSLQTLAKTETMLPDSFMRIHRSYIVALDKISEIGHRKRIRIGDEIIPVGDNYYEAFCRKLNLEK